MDRRIAALILLLALGCSSPIESERVTVIDRPPTGIPKDTTIVIIEREAP
jgi:hypothetical protein